MERRASVDIGICTCGRPELLDALTSVAGQTALAHVDVRVVVADNAETPQALGAARCAAARLGLTLAYVHAPARNISVARNACLDAARGDWVAFLDDDETAAPGWLAALLAEAATGGWDAVLGPVDACYPPGAPAWVRQADLHSTRPVPVRGRILTGYAGNVLLRRARVEAAKLRFDPALGRCGGEDVDFFCRLVEVGGRIGYAAGALAHERVSEERLAFAWMLRRRFRAGQTHGRQLARRSGALGRLADGLVAAGKTGACLGAAAAFAPNTMRRNAFVLRAALHAGVVSRLAGVPELELY